MYPYTRSLTTGLTRMKTHDPPVASRVRTTSDTYILIAMIHLIIFFLRSYTCTKCGCDLARAEIFNLAKGDRKDVINFCLLYTDGNANRPKDNMQVKAAADQLRAEGKNTITLTQ